MTQPQNELLPCPACHASGEDNVYERTVYMNVKQIGCVACGLKGPSGSAQDAFDKWQQMPRSSPPVAPGLRDRIYDALFNDHICGNDPDSKIQRAADIAAAQVQPDTELRDAIKYMDWLRGLPDWLESNREQNGELIFSKKVADQTIEILRASLAAAQGGQVDSLRDFDQWMEQVYLDYNKAAAYGECDAVRYVADEFRKRLAAVPSAPGADRVKAALSAYTDPLDSDEYYAPLFTELRDAIAALGAPQGSDSLRWTTDIPSDSEYGWYWYDDGHLEIFPVLIQKIAGTGQAGFVVVGQIYILNILKNERVPFRLLRIPEPAQPVDGGEAQERGE